MYKRNDGTEQMNALQNQFTAYITTSMHRSRLLYLRRKAQIYQQEIAFEEFHLVLPSEIDALEQSVTLLTPSRKKNGKSFWQE